MMNVLNKVLRSSAKIILMNYSNVSVRFEQVKAAGSEIIFLYVLPRFQEGSSFFPSLGL